jgi:hypothetical protein
MLVEAQTVIACRTLGMMGLWTVAPDENWQMVLEKQKAFASSIAAASVSAMSGDKTGQVLSAALRPIGTTTARNVKRLGKHGFTQL